MMSIKQNSFADFLKYIHQLLFKTKHEENLAWYKVLWQKIRVWAMLVLGLSILAVLISQISLSEFLKVFSNVNIGYFIAAYLVGVSATILKTVRYGYFFPAPGRWLSLYGTFAIMRVVYYLLPFNSGELVNLGILKKNKFLPTIAEAAPAWFFLRITDVLALSLFFTIALIIAPSSGILYGEMYSFRWFVIGISAGLMIAMLTIPLWLPKITVKVSNNWLASRLTALQTGFKRTSEITAFARTIVIAIVIWTFLIGTYILSQITFNAPLGFSECFLVAVTVYCVSLLPINTPLNIGTDEAIWSGAMIMSGVNPTQAISIAISIRIISMLVIFTDGLIGFILVFFRFGGSQRKINLQKN